MKNLVNWFKKNIYGTVIETGKVTRVGFNGGEDWYIDKVLYRFGRKLEYHRYWDKQDFISEIKNKVVKKERIIIKGFSIK
jgi:hypothetical protein